VEVIGHDAISQHPAAAVIPRNQRRLGSGERNQIVALGRQSFDPKRTGQPERHTHEANEIFNVPLREREVVMRAIKQDFPERGIGTDSLKLRHRPHLANLC
jgi:hypothetical protein